MEDEDLEETADEEEPVDPPQPDPEDSECVCPDQGCNLDHDN